MDIPYTQQFSAEQTPLYKLLPILRQYAGDRGALKKAFAGAFFKQTKTPEKIAGNTTIALRAHGILTTEGSLTPFGKTLVEMEPADAGIEVAKNILHNLGGFQVAEALREMSLGGHALSLVSLTNELKQRGINVSDNSSDLSGVCGWLRAAGILTDWRVNEEVYQKIIGTDTKTLEALKNLSSSQVAFLRAMVALNVTDFTVYTSIVKHAEALFSGQVIFNKKVLEKDIIQPLEKFGFLEVRRQEKSVTGARGGKPADVRPTQKFEKEIATPILESLFKNCGLKDLRRIRSIPLNQLVADVRQNHNIHLKGESLEILAIRFCQLLGLDFMGWRQTDEKVSAGGEVDAIMQSSRLIYSRWQIQCKATDNITYETLAKEFGVSVVSLASVILIVSTGKMTEGANKYRAHVVQKTPLNMIVIDGPMLDAIVADASIIGAVLEKQAKDAMRLKEQLIPLVTSIA